MTLTLRSVFAEGWGYWRRDRAALLPLVGPFVFLPALAWQLLMPPQPALPADASLADAVAALGAWAQANLGWIALRLALATYAAATILAFYLARDHRDVGGVLRSAARLLPPLILAQLATAALTAAGLFAFVIPAFYIAARLWLTNAAIVAERGGVGRGIARSVTLSRGRGWQLAGMLLLPTLVSWLPLRLLDALDAAAAGNPVPHAILAALLAAVGSAVAVANVLIAVVLYRRLAAPRHGI